MLKGKTKIYKSGSSKYFLIPHEVLSDSHFPFKEDKEIDFEIKGKKIIIG
mgnify:FL=1